MKAYQENFENKGFRCPSDNDFKGIMDKIDPNVQDKKLLECMWCPGSCDCGFDCGGCIPLKGISINWQ